MKRTGSKTTQGRTIGCTRTEGAPVWMAGANSTGLNNKLGREADETNNISWGVTFFILRLQRLLHVRGCARYARTE